MCQALVRILLVEGDEDNHVFTRSLFSKINGELFQLERVATYDAALARIAQKQHDVYLIDYGLGQNDGLNLLQASVAIGCDAPIILLTEQSDQEIDLVAMAAGAADSLTKSEITALLLQRSIRYAIDRCNVLKALSQALQQKSQLALAIANVTSGIVITDPTQPNNPVIFVNPAFTKLTGYTAAETLGKNCRFLQGSDSNPHVIRQIREAIVRQQPVTCTLLNYRKDGTCFWNEISINPVFDEDGKLINFIGLQTDITDRKQAEKALQESEERYALAVQGANDGIWDWNLKTGEVYFSSRWKAMLGYAEHEIGHASEEWFKRVHPEDLYWLKREITIHQDGLTPHFESEHRMLNRDGVYCWMLSRGLAVRDTTGQATRIAGSQTDVTIRKRAEEKLIHDALYDTLTGLPNRVLFTERLRHAVQLAQRSQEYLFAILFIDLDRFKVINDSLGHMLGDRLLVEIAHRLSSCLRPSDTIARLGGDEFVILLEDIKDSATVTQVADRIQRDLSVSFRLEGHEIFTAASIGIALSSTHYEQPEDLLRDADTAMYRAKAQGKARHAIFHPGMHTHAVALLQIETDLRRAIERNELLLHYQPIISLGSRQIIGFEALLRWQHAKRGMVSPAEFIPIAEETGQIVPIGWWVLQEACQQMQQWRQQFPNYPNLRVNVNISGRQFTSHLIEQVSQILQKTGLDAQYLKLEITESILMGNAESAVSTLTQLKQLGIQLAIDDFGTGYSSLSYLHRFPIDCLKVDRSFISKLDVDGEQLAIVRTIITLAWNLGMEVVAEGVETPKQLSQLRALHCESAQGFLFSKPLPADAAKHLLNTELEEWQPKKLGI